MKSTLTFTLSTGRAVEVSLTASDGAALKVAEVFEVIRHCGQEVGEFGREVAREGREAMLAQSLKALLVKRRAATVTTQALVARLRKLHPTLTERNIERLLPRVMATHYGAGVSHDVRSPKGQHVRGYHGVTLKLEAKK